MSPMVLAAEYLHCGLKLKPGKFRKVQEYSDLCPSSVKDRHQAWLIAISNGIFQFTSKSS